MDALLVVDVQNDFCADGILRCYDTVNLIPEINSTIEFFEKKCKLIIFTKDWHSKRHCSFRGNMDEFTIQNDYPCEPHSSFEFPEHCVKDTKGAELSSLLYLPSFYSVIHKGVGDRNLGFSAFENPELSNLLMYNNVKNLMVCGLATEYCVLKTIQCAVSHNFNVISSNKLIRPVAPESKEEISALNWFRKNILFFEK